MCCLTKVFKSKYLFKIYAIIIIFGLMTEGCVSYKEVKEMEVNESLTIESVGAEELSACTWELMKENGGQIYHRSYDPIRKKWFITSEFTTWTGSGNGVYNYSVSFEDIPGKKTLIEIRSLKTIWGNTQAPIDSIFQQCKKCQASLL